MDGVTDNINTINPTSATAAAAPPAPNIDTAQPPMAASPAQTAPLPQAPNMPMQQPSNPADVNANAAMNPNANASMTPAQKHASIFHSVFSMLGGGGNRPQMDAQGNPILNPDGTPKMGQASTKQLGMGILAGAISGMMAGMATPTKYNEVAPGRFAPDYSGAFGAGAKAAQPFTQQGSKAAAQQQADINTTRQYTTLKNNLDMHLLMQGVHRGDTQDFQSAVDSFSETLQNAQDEQDAGNLKDDKGNPIQLIRDGEYTNEQGLDMLKKGQISSVKSQMIPSRVIQVPNDPSDPSKGMHPVMMYKILTDAGTGLGTVPLTDAMKKELGSKWDNAPVDTTKVPISLLLQNAHTRATSAQAGGTVSDWQNELKAVDPDNQKLKDFSYSAWSASNPVDAKALNQVLTAHKGQHADIGLNQILTNKDFSGDSKVMSAINKLQQAMGVNGETLDKIFRDRESKVLDLKNREAEDRAAALEKAKEKTPEGQLKLQNAQLDLTLKRQQVAQNDANAKAVQVPQGFVADPRANELPSNELRSQLSSKGVTIPSDWEALYTIGHNDADLATYTSSPRKGVQTMPRPQALAFIRTYINPNYNEGDYKANANLIKEVRDTKVGTAGGSLLAAGVASNHLDLLAQAGTALRNHDVQLWNSLCAKAGVATGSAPPVVFQAIGQKLNEEVEKVTSGGTPQVASLKEAHENLNVAQSPEQIEGVINSYLGLMNGRVSEIDFRANQYTGRHVSVSPMTAKVFNSRGYTVPGQPSISYKPVTNNGLIVGWTNNGGKTMVQTQLYR